jgi:hypothetical protein
LNQDIQTKENNMITILVGEANPGVQEDINFGTTWGEMLPKEQVQAFDEYYTGNYSDDTNIIIRVYTATIIDWVGEQIEAGNIQSHHVYIHTPNGGVHYFDANGVIDATWPHGIFNY